MHARLQLFLHTSREIPIFEQLVDPDGNSPARLRFTALSLKAREATGSPVRAIATVAE